MDTGNRKTRGASGSATRGWLLKRLETLASDRQAIVPQYPESYLRALEIFPQAVIEAACDRLANLPVADYKPRFPTKAEMVETCREAERVLERRPASEWSCSDFAVCRMIDRYVAERMEDKRWTREQVFAEMRVQNLAAQSMYVRWKNQHMTGTLIPPPMWCDECEGLGIVPCNMDGSLPWNKKTSPRTRPCPVCGKKAA